MWLTRLALRNPVLILMAALMVLVLGLVSLQRLPVDLFPEISLPVIRVATFYGGAGPADIEQSVTQPMERAVASAPGVDRIESTSKQGLSVVSVWFAWAPTSTPRSLKCSSASARFSTRCPRGCSSPSS